MIRQHNGAPTALLTLPRQRNSGGVKEALRTVARRRGGCPAQNRTVVRRCEGRLTRGSLTVRW